MFTFKHFEYWMKSLGEGRFSSNFAAICCKKGINVICNCFIFKAVIIVNVQNNVAISFGIMSILKTFQTWPRLFLKGGGGVRLFSSSLSLKWPDFASLHCFWAKFLMLQYDLYTSCIPDWNSTNAYLLSEYSPKIHSSVFFWFLSLV